ncbi:hypothetical protein ACK249_003746 [Pseudomonas aeruginosa]|uniref:hypothetical protein n=1 Tax=Pseudomonas aeruginosa TaxID=287 RepID=UPI002557544E|nr:hypothetical protein [Pseudomonas aeruginosa]EKF7416707.1 hypothetical protein [Pseudomonas aeruginosa]HBO1617632.1 hypothetical protein [Pseudomonas aeruginosa]HBO9385135.1 hypothetical protein [Pseudomonas aeruginosa]HCA5867076.1 hypothetical protein [Pseudomonas aeruginosa]HCA7377489.1 hypothetical protein [Pseudomonas aeruginosa]
MIVYTSITALFFSLVTGIAGFEFWGTKPWWQGCAAGFALAIAWIGNRTVARLMGVFGILLLAWIALGNANELTSHTRAFFNGMSLAMPFGFAIFIWWRWQVFRPKVVSIANIEGVNWLLRLLGERR